MVIFFEINPPKVIEGESNSDALERMHNLAKKFDSILQTCGGVLVTDSVLGKPRFDPVKMACIIKESHPNLEIIVSMRVIDKTKAAVSQFVTKTHDQKIDGILVIKGDPGEGTDSGLIPSTVAKTISTETRTYLSVPSRPNYAKIQKKIDSNPAGFFTQVIRNRDDVDNICKKLTPLGFRIIPCILIPSEKNLPSAKFLNLDWSPYSQNIEEFIKFVHETAGDVLLTSPSDMQTAVSVLDAFRL